MNNLSSETKKNKIISNQARMNFINRICIEGYNLKDAAILTDIPFENAKKIFAKYKATGIVEKAKTGSPVNKKITEEIKNLIETIIENTPSITLVEIKNKILENFNVGVCIESIRLCITELGITKKNITMTGIQVNSERSKNLRKLYAIDFLNNFHNDMQNIFIDESGFNLHLRRRQGRSHRGQLVQQLVPQTRGTNISLIMAINNNEVLYCKCVTGAVNALVFKEFLQSLLMICRNKFENESFTFFADNAKIHHSNIVREFLLSENLNLQFLSPYSYMLNPIEFSFSKIKAMVRRDLSNGFDGELVDLIYRAISTLSSNDLIGYFHHIRSNCVKAIELSDFN